MIPLAVPHAVGDVYDGCGPSSSALSFHICLFVLRLPCCYLLGARANNKGTNEIIIERIRILRRFNAARIVNTTPDPSTYPQPYPDYYTRVPLLFAFGS